MLSAIALYSSGPVTPSMRNRPCGSWWPSDRHSRAVSTSSSRPTSRSNSSSPVASGSGRPRRRCRRRRGTRRCRRASSPSTPGRRSCARGTPRPRGRAAAARSLGEAERGVPPAQRVAGRLGQRVGEHRQDERLRVPEGVAVVAGAGQALGRDRAPLGAGARLQRVEQREADGLLQLGVAVELDVGALPRSRRGTRCWASRAVPAGVTWPRRARPRPGRAPRGRQRSLGPAVGQELDDPQPLAGGEVGGHA